jgi:hypothetical protein
MQRVLKKLVFGELLSFVELLNLTEIFYASKAFA